MNENETRVPQCEDCPLLNRRYPSLPTLQSSPNEEGGYVCLIDGEFIPASLAPREGGCDRLAGYRAVPCRAAPPHPLDAALTRQNWQAAAEWLRANVPAEVLRKVWPGPSASYITAWNESHPRADGRVEN